MGIVGLSHAVTSIQDQVRSVAEFVLVLLSMYLCVYVVHESQNRRLGM